jgi:uncharacterized membrane protein YdbT with pleckstrin-like domain
MSYIERILQPGERVIAIGRIHPIIYIRTVFVILVGIAALILGLAYGDANGRLVGNIVFGVLLVVGFVAFLATYIHRKFTEIAVTDRRIVYKTGIVRRHSVEMNMNRVESVVVDQSIAGRLLNFGTIHVRGVGVGIENLTRIGHPLELRSAILAR